MEVKTVIRNHIQSDILQRQDMKLEDNTPLIDDGYLTSLQAVELVMFLEERFGVQIDPEEVNEDDFRSLESISSLVQGKLG